MSSAALCGLKDEEMCSRVFRVLLGGLILAPGDVLVAFMAFEVGC